MFYINILTQPGRIENKGTHEYKILTIQQEQAFIEEGLAIREHVYKLQCGLTTVEVYCPEIAELGNSNEARYLILPEFLIPGRPYPIYVYLYAIETYCTNPWMGQRDAAKRTQERFGLKTFSHTTLGRAMKKLERQIEKYEIAPQNKDSRNEATDTTGEKLPSVEQTKGRRAAVASHLMKAAGGVAPIAQEAAQPLKKPDYRRLPYAGAFIDACHGIVVYTFLNYHSFLL